MSIPFNSHSKESILKHALLLVDKSLRETLRDLNLESNAVNKGGFGQVLEKFYFMKELDSSSQPDFPEAGLELKSSPIKKLKTKGQLRAKERLVLNIINYEDLVAQEFYSSSFFTKNSNLLLVFYFHEKDIDVLDYKVKLVGLWEFPKEDLKVIEHDWKLIQLKVKQGEAHKLSEGDTFYLGACTKGASAKSIRKQPFSSEPAKQRAFSLKTGYVNHILAKLSGTVDGSFGKLADVPDLEENDFDIEALVLKKIQTYYGLTPEQIANELNLNYNLEAKQRFSQLSKALVKGILGVEDKKEVEEFSKADITIKTVRLNRKNLPCENISFPAFKYLDLINEESWEHSGFNEHLEKRFLFVFFKENDSGDFILDKALFWNMPYEDREEARKVWEQMKSLIHAGDIVKEISKNGIFKTHFPKQKESRVAHVRPHAKDRNDTYPLPKPDKLTGRTAYMKHSFWLNNQYIKDHVYLKDAS